MKELTSKLRVVDTEKDRKKREEKKRKMKEKEKKVRAGQLELYT